MNYAVAQLDNAEFNLYSLLLVISGISLIVMAATGFGGRTTTARGINGAFGVLFIGYAIYLQFIFNGGTVFVSYYVFFLPFLLIIHGFRMRGAAKRQEAQRKEPGFPPIPQTGYPNPQAGYPAPQQSGYPNPQTGYPNPQTGYPNPQTGYPNPQTGYPAPQQSGYPNPQTGYPAPRQSEGGYPAPQGGYAAPQQPGYPPQGGYPPPQRYGERTPEAPPPDPTAPRY